MKSLSVVCAALALSFAWWASLAAQPEADNKDAAAKSASPAQLATAANAPAEQSKTPAAEEKKLVLPNASDYVNEGVACGTAK